LCNIANQIHPLYVSIQTSIPFFETILTTLKKCSIGFGDQQVSNPIELVWRQAYNSKVDYTRQWRLDKSQNMDQTKVGNKK
jgi:hypothetical protein